jgi:hypothetical protein
MTNLADDSTGDEIKHGEPFLPKTKQHMIRRTLVETIESPNKEWFFRCPLIYPINARQWRGPFADEDTAIADYMAKTKIPTINNTDLAVLKKHDRLTEIDGVPMMMHHDPLTHATCLTRYTLETN